MTPAINKSIKPMMVFGGSWIAKPPATATSPIACLLAAACPFSAPVGRVVVDRSGCWEEETRGAFSLANDSKWSPQRQASDDL
jgi:hypothetical protein